jgi:hypothetical protein
VYVGNAAPNRDSQNSFRQRNQVIRYRDCCKFGQLSIVISPLQQLVGGAKGLQNQEEKLCGTSPNGLEAFWAIISGNIYTLFFVTLFSKAKDLTVTVTKLGLGNTSSPSVTVTVTSIHGRTVQASNCSSTSGAIEFDLFEFISETSHGICL